MNTFQAKEDQSWKVGGGDHKRLAGDDGVMWECYEEVIHNRTLFVLLIAYLMLEMQ